MRLADICRCLYYYGQDQDHVIERQISQRLELVEFWKVCPDYRILEVGCGEGITTVALAAAVGEKGQVVAVDIDGPDQWEDPPLGELVDHVRNSALGDRIQFMLATDLLDPHVEFADAYFDLAVFNQCAWYFPDPDLLRQLFVRVHPWAQRLGYHEWDVNPDTMEQIPHMLSAMIQAHLESLGFEVGNIKSLILPEESKAIAVESGWEIVDQCRLESSHTMPDGIDWEPQMGVQYAEKYLNQPDQSPSQHSRHLIASQMKMLMQLNKCTDRQSLTSHAFLAMQGQG